MSTDRLDSFADAYIESVLAIIDRLELNQSVDPVSTNASLQRQLNEGKTQLSPDLWHQACYALAAWTDELMVEMPWQGRDWWNDHVLESKLFGTRVCSERFFELAKQATANPENGLLRIFHDCVLLGFRGVYSLDAYGETIRQEMGLPSSLHQWLADVQGRVAAVSIRQDCARQHRDIGGAPPQSDQRTLVWWTVAACTTLGINLTVYSFLNH